MFGIAAAMSGDFFDFLDALSGKILLPLGGFLVAIFTGWIVSRALLRTELSQAGNALFAGWIFSIRWLAPAAVGLIIVSGIASTFGVSLPFLG